MIKAIIFDMDGVIVDSEPCALENRLAYLRQVGIEADDRKLAGLLGRNMADVWRIIAPSKDALQLQAGYVAYKQAHPIPYAKIVMPGARPTLQWLKQHDIKKMCTETGLRQYFDQLLSGADFTRTKPAPDVYLAALQVLDVAAEEAIAVEDSTLGIAAAKAAGLYTLAVPLRDPRFTQNQQAADQRIKKLTDIMGIVDDKNAYNQ